jgi:hypothetical protein
VKTKANEPTLEELQAQRDAIDSQIRKRELAAESAERGRVLDEQFGRMRKDLEAIRAAAKANPQAAALVRQWAKAVQDEFGDK